MLSASVAEFRIQAKKKPNYNLKAPTASNARLPVSVVQVRAKRCLLLLFWGEGGEGKIFAQFPGLRGEKGSPSGFYPLV